jgi:hypothetical protein
VKYPFKNEQSGQHDFLLREESRSTPFLRIHYGTGGDITRPQIFLKGKGNNAFYK